MEKVCGAARHRRDQAAAAVKSEKKREEVAKTS